MFILILALFSLAYFILILWFIIGFDKCDEIVNLHEKAQENFSVIIPIRNEEANLPGLLASLSRLKYPSSKFEMIFIDDDSQDHSITIVKKWQLENKKFTTSLLNNIRITNSPKKDALTLAISKSKFNWIVTTDADCIIPKNWLAMFNQIILNKNPYLIAAPVKFKKNHSFLHQFQNFNFLSLIGSTIGAFGLKKPFMCNGANLCYSKGIFNDVNGFEENANLASGDDIFILEKIIKNYPRKAIYLKSEEAIVATKSEANWGLFVQQQLRWASKTNAYTNLFTKGIGILVFLQNLLLIVYCLLLIINKEYFQYFIIIFTLKLVIDYSLINKTAKFLNSKINFINFLFSSILYPLFVTYIGVLSITKNYEWKGRTFKS